MTVKELIEKLNKEIERDKDIENLKVCISDYEYGTFEVDTVKVDKVYLRIDFELGDNKPQLAVMLY